MHPFLSPSTPHLFAHRGACCEAPENTMPAFEAAWSCGARYLETDCHATRDGEIILCHDAELARTTNGTGPVSALTYAELCQLDAGHHFSVDGESHPFRGRGLRMPRLVDLLDALPEARINLEIKQADPPIAEAVVKLVQSRGATNRVLLAAEDDAILDRVRALDAGTALGTSRGDAVRFFQAVAEDRLDDYTARGDALQIPPEFMGSSLVTPAHLEAAHTVGLCVHVWTINDADEMRALLAARVDGVMSDDPRLLLRVASEVSD